MSDMSKEPLDLDAIESAWWRGERPADVPALVRELREARANLANIGDLVKSRQEVCSQLIDMQIERDEARRESAAVRLETGDGWQVTHVLAERVKMMREAADHWKAMLQDRVKEREEARRERDEAKDERSSMWQRFERCNAKYNETIARAERAEAACAQMRVAAERVLTAQRDAHVTHPTVIGACEVAESKNALRDLLAATDCGKGYASPEQHAEVVANREGLRRQVAEGNRVADEQEEKLRAQLAEVTAQAAVMREALEFVARYPMTRDSHRWAEVEISKVDDALASDAGKALAERVKLLEAVAKEAHAYWATSPTYHRNLNPLCAALAALDAHDKQEGR